MPMATVTLCFRSNEMALSCVNGGPGSLTVKSNETHYWYRFKTIRLYSHPSVLPYGGERPRGDEHDADACRGDVFGEEMRFGGACDCQLDGGPVCLFDLALEVQEGGDNVRALCLHDKRRLALR